jgi:DNA polymerase-3 subunit epsilon
LREPQSRRHKNYFLSRSHEERKNEKIIFLRLLRDFVVKDCSFGKEKNMRQIVLDTETTGLEPAQGHRIIEIGCVEMINRRLTGNHYHQYIQPDREIDDGAIEVHGISNEFLADKPRFQDIVEDFLRYVKDAELIIHNAPFDIGFINSELQRYEKNHPTIENLCGIIDTLALARELHPGQKNNLDALCKRYDVDNSHRELHGALLDAEILADVYLRMTGGQEALFVESQQQAAEVSHQEINRISSDRAALNIVYANQAEIEAHEQRLQAIQKASGGQCLWLKQ